MTNSTHEEPKDVKRLRTARRSMMYVVRSLLLVILAVILCIGAFLTAERYSNLYILTSEGMALVSPLIFKLYASETGPQAQVDTDGLQVQREVIKAGWHRMTSAQGSGRLNILRYAVLGRGGVAVGKISAVVLTEPDRWVMPVPPANPVLQLA